MQRLSQQFPLRRGSHPSRADGMCTMEMVAWLAGEAHSDEPECTCPVIAAFVRAINDALPSDESRDRWLRPLVPLLVNTRGRLVDEQRRGMQVADAMTRVFVPHLLEKRGRHDEAAALRLLPPVTDTDTAQTALRALDCWGRELHAARWVLQRASENHPPARFVAGAVQILRRAGDPTAWQHAIELIHTLSGSVAAGRQQNESGTR